jgi:hypothetical protein
LIPLKKQLAPTKSSKIVLRLNGQEALRCIHLVESMDNCAVFSKIEENIYCLTCTQEFLSETLCAVATLELPLFNSIDGKPKCEVYPIAENCPLNKKEEPCND